MTTTIAPSLGHAPVLTQAGTGASPGYDAIDFRRLATIGLQEGVLGVSSFEVTQRSAGGAGMFVDIAANVADALGTGIAAVVQGDAVTAQGLYPIPGHSAIITEAIGANASGNPRIDQVVLEVLDHTHDGSGSNLVRTRVVAGTATSGATLANRTGAAALPSSALLLADVLVANGAASITNSVIRDRRRWARGAYCRLALASDVSLTGPTAFTQISSALSARIECSGAPVRLSLVATWQAGGVSPYFPCVRPTMDGSPIESTGNGWEWDTASAAGLTDILNVAYVFTPTAGSHVFDWQAASFSASDNILFLSNPANVQPAFATIEEILRQNTANNPTTTG